MGSIPPSIHSATESPAIGATWTNPRTGARLAVRNDVVRLLSRAALRGLKERREIGGLLWGSKLPDPNCGVAIDGAELFPSTGHLFSFDPTNRDLLLKTMQSPAIGNRALVGYVRSHLREGLCLSEQDSEYITKHMRDRSMVFLVIRPFKIGICMAGFFFWDGNQLQTSASEMEVPFVPQDETDPIGEEVGDEQTDRMDFAEQSRSVVQRAQSSGELPPSPANARPLFTADRRAPARLNPASSAVAAAVALAGAALFAIGTAGPVPNWRAAVMPPREPRLTPLDFRAVRLGPQQVEIAWNGSDVLFTDRVGRLIVSDVRGSRAFGLNGTQLKAGRLVYLLNGSERRFQLEIALENGRSVSESLRVPGY